MSINRPFRWSSFAITAVLVVTVSDASYAAGTLYEENFTGNELDILNGVGPDLDNNGGFNTWTAHSGFRADGSITVPAGGAGAWLPFVPEDGSTYTLTASLTAVTGDANWFALGFGESVPATPEGTGNDFRFISGATAGKAWMLFRGDNTANPNQTLRGDANSGTFVDGTLAWNGGPTGGGDIDLRVVLDTSGGTGNYSASFFAKLPTDVNYTDVGGGVLDLNDELIGAVGFVGSNAAIDAAITNFTLETSGDIIVPGDVDGDGVADVSDFNVIRDNLFDIVTMRSQGDLNSDGTVDFSDFRIWKDVFEAGGGSTAGLFLQVPEPGSMALLIAGCSLIMFAASNRFRRPKSLARVS